MYVVTDRVYYRIIIHYCKLLFFSSFQFYLEIPCVENLNILNAKINYLIRKSSHLKEHLFNRGVIFNSTEYHANFDIYSFMNSGTLLLSSVTRGKSYLILSSA